MDKSIGSGSKDSDNWDYGAPSDDEQVDKDENDRLKGLSIREPEDDVGLSTPKSDK